MEKIPKPRRTVRELIFDINFEYGIKTSIGAIYRVLKAMEELNLNSESETESDDVVEIIPEVIEEQKKLEQSSITDFFLSKK